MQKVSTNPAARHKTRTFTNSLVRYLMLSYVPHFLCGEATNNPQIPPRFQSTEERFRERTED